MFKDNYNVCRIKLEFIEEKNKIIIFVWNEWLINFYLLLMFCYFVEFYF